MNCRYRLMSCTPGGHLARGLHLAKSLTDTRQPRAWACAHESAFALQSSARCMQSGRAGSARSAALACSVARKRLSGTRYFFT